MSEGLRHTLFMMADLGIMLMLLSDFMLIMLRVYNPDKSDHSFQASAWVWGSSALYIFFRSQGAI